MNKFYYPGQNDRYSREIHEVDLQFDHVISSFGSTLTLPTVSERHQLALQSEVDVAWYHVIVLLINIIKISAVTIIFFGLGNMCIRILWYSKQAKLFFFLFFFKLPLLHISVPSIRVSTVTHHCTLHVCTHFWHEVVYLNPVNNQTGKRHFSCVSMATNGDLHRALVTVVHCCELLITNINFKLSFLALLFYADQLFCFWPDTGFFV